MTPPQAIDVITRTISETTLPGAPGHWDEFGNLLRASRDAPAVVRALAPLPATADADRI